MPKRNQPDFDTIIVSRTQLSELIQNSDEYLRITFTPQVSDAEFIRRVKNLAPEATKTQILQLRKGPIRTLKGKFIKFTPLGYLLMECEIDDEDEIKMDLRNIDPRTLIEVTTSTANYIQGRKSKKW